MQALVFFSSLALFAADVPGPKLGHPGLPQRIVGKLLEWSVEAGMSEEQVVAVFGKPDICDAFTRGPIGYEVTTSFYSYLRYDASVTFDSRPGLHNKGRPGVRVHGGIQ